MRFLTDAEGDPTHFRCIHCDDAWVYVNAHNCPACGADYWQENDDE